MTSQLTEDGAALLRAGAYLSKPGEPWPLPWEVTDRGLSGLQAAWPPETPHSEPLGRSTPPGSHPVLSYRIVHWRPPWAWANSQLWWGSGK